MMAQKALLFGDKINFDKIVNCKKPGEAKELGRQVIGYDDTIWNEKKFEIVKLGNIHKFSQYPELKRLSFTDEKQSSGRSQPRRHDLGGVGLAQESQDITNIDAWRRLNLLGFALMETRDYLKELG